MAELQTGILGSGFSRSKALTWIVSPAFNALQESEHLGTQSGEKSPFGSLARDFVTHTISWGLSLQKGSLFERSRDCGEIVTLEIALSLALGLGGFDQVENFLRGFRFRLGRVHVRHLP